MSYVIGAVCVGVVLWHTFFVWPKDDRPLAKVYYMDDYRYRPPMETNGKPPRRRLEDKIENRVLPILYAAALLLGVLILAALAVMAWQEIL